MVKALRQPAVTSATNHAAIAAKKAATDQRISQTKCGIARSRRKVLAGADADGRR